MNITANSDGLSPPLLYRSTRWASWLHSSVCQLVDDVAGVHQGTGKPIKLGDHKGVALTAGRVRLAESGPISIGAGEAVVDVDTILRHPHTQKGVALGGQVLLLS